MTDFRYIKGNLITLALNDYFDIIIHGCNCFHTMGAGIAKSIKQTFPLAYKADLETKKGDKSKLGNYSFAKCKTKTGNDLVVINAYTQYDYGRKSIHCNYEAICDVLFKIGRNFMGRIGMPKIGCGLAGGNWDILEKPIKLLFSGNDVTIVEYNNREF